MSEHSEPLTLTSSVALALAALAGLSAAGCGGDAMPESESVGEAPAAVDAPPPSAGPTFAETQRMSSYVDSLYPPGSVRHSFRLSSDHQVDCVDVYAQPGMRTPEMAGQVIATPPTAHQPAGAGVQPLSSTDGMEAFLKKGQRDAHGDEMWCPGGTIPIRRLTLEDAERFATLDDMMRKNAADKGPLAAEEVPALYGPTSLHQYAHAAQYNLSNVGAHTLINVWDPYVQSSAEFSLSQLWVVRGSGTGLQTVEAGVQVYANLYGNSSPHLFIYSTSDGYHSTGCYNLTCSRFVQVAGNIVPGAGVSPFSTNGGTQYELDFSWLLYQGNWWLSVQGTWIGYYPGKLFNAAGLANGASVIDFGGEIIDDRTKHSYHTLTDMGSGAYPSAGWMHAAYQRRIYYYANASTSYWATGITPYRDNAYCYDISRFNNDPNWGTYIFFGGPGYNSNCL